MLDISIAFCLHYKNISSKAKLHRIQYTGIYVAKLRDHFKKTPRIPRICTDSCEQNERYMGGPLAHIPIREICEIRGVFKNSGAGLDKIENGRGF